MSVRAMKQKSENGLQALTGNNFLALSFVSRL